MNYLYLINIFLYIIIIKWIWFIVNSLRVNILNITFSALSISGCKTDLNFWSIIEILSIVGTPLKKYTIHKYLLLREETDLKELTWLSQLAFNHEREQRVLILMKFLGLAINNLGIVGNKRWSANKTIRDIVTTISYEGFSNLEYFLRYMLKIYLWMTIYRYDERCSYAS